MAGQIDEKGLGDEGVRKALDLCLECRACKTECPVGVDVARFKSEFLADYWRRHGTPLRATVLGNVHKFSPIGSRFAPFSNLIARSWPARVINQAITGIDRRRLPPRWARKTLTQQIGSRTGDVLVFNDTFTNYYNPAIGVAGIEVMQRLGFTTALAPNLCCGRPLISQGLLAEARRHAELNTDRLSEFAVKRQPLVFFEPSCLSAVREDMPALVRGFARHRAEQIARMSMMFEEFVEQACASGHATLSLVRGPAQVLLHGHCHQKSMGALAPAKALLQRIPGATVIDLDAGCCGMAGSFGYVREHYDVSRAIGERKLLPAARNLGADAVLVASGVSCRHQVADFTSVRALHAAELIHSLLAETS
jgi:Fe-S oxidoreductase